MKLYNIVISTNPDITGPKDITLNELLGKDLNEYYDGWGIDKETGIKDFYFYDVPTKLMKIIKVKIKKIDYLTCKIDEVK